VDPLSRDADPFTADHKHLDRFRREVSANPRKRPNPRGGNTRAERKSYIRATAWKDPDRAYELVRETARSDVELVDLYDAVAAIRSALEEEAEQRAMALTATRNNDRVGLILFTDEVQLYLPPRKGKVHKGAAREAVAALLRDLESDGVIP